MVETLNDREKMIIEYQSELMRQNKLLESVINSLSDGILIINEKFEILRATPKILNWFGIKGKDIIGKNVFEFINVLISKQKLEEKLNLMIYGSAEIREKGGKKYIYVHYRDAGVPTTKYAGEYTDELYNLLLRIIIQ